MKTKVKHRVPLSARCMEILANAKGIAAGGEFVFPGRDPQHHMSNMAFEITLRRMQRADITAHGFRSSFPAPVKLGPRITVWWVADIQALIEVAKQGAVWKRLLLHSPKLIFECLLLFVLAWEKITHKDKIRNS